MISKILGIAHDLIPSTSVLMIDGEIIAGAAEERFSRLNKDRSFPSKSTEFCLKQGMISIDEVDAVAIPWNPGIHMKKFNPVLSSRRRWRGEFLYSIPDNIFKLFPEKEIGTLSQTFSVNGKSMEFYYIDHHLCHAANAFYLSPFRRAAILTVDGRGEEKTCLFAVADEHGIRELDSILVPHSLGSFYSTYTDFLGFNPESDEWKVMALSAYNIHDERTYQFIRNSVNLLNDGKFELDISLYSEIIHEQRNYYTGKLVTAFGSPRKKNGEIEKRDIYIACAMQKVFEETMTHMLAHAHKITGMEDIALSGGCLMNSVFNGKICRLSPFKNVFISSCPDDSGESIGAALYLHHEILKKPKRLAQRENYYGPGFTNEEISDYIRKYALRAEYAENIEQITARYIHEGRLVGWFQGRMEFGPRALGNRSILCDPRSDAMKDKVNLAVKYRESFRPFAPAILEERVREYFLVDSSANVPFMEKVYPIIPGKRSLIPAVTHVDGTGRLQSVSREINPRFYGLIQEFEKLSGIPIILNTSFNLNGEPIVADPEDAIRTFYSCGLEVLVMGNYIIKK